ILENHAYHRLLLLFAGDLDEAALLKEAKLNPTVAYGLARWSAMEGRSAEARQRLQALMEIDEPERDGRWASFGFIAAEADLAR
ncbi:MAG: hypothetical protein AB8H79_03970, partial [Myxococcota bacterium]